MRCGGGGGGLRTWDCMGSVVVVVVLTWSEAGELEHFYAGEGRWLAHCGWMVL